MSRLQGFSPTVRKQIKERAGLDDTGETVWVRCEGCGVWCSSGFFDLHHRIPRGAGGTKRLHVNGAANGLCLCSRGCHLWAESNREAARSRGWLISAHTKTLPSEVPVHMWDGCYLLADDGKRYSVPCRHQEAA